MVFRTRSMAVTLGAAAALALPLAAPGNAVSVSDPIVEGLAGPLGLALGPKGSFAVSQSFGGQVTGVSANGATTPLVSASGPADFFTGLAMGKWHLIYLVNTADAAGTPQGLVRKLRKDGTTATIADVAKVELNKNPDGDVMYGFQGLDDECAATVPEEPLLGGSPFPGDVNPNAFAVAAAKNGDFYVADAGGNTILRVHHRRVKVAALLPPRTQRITAEQAATLGLDDCVIGEKYKFHFVPTDVEIGRNGMLYVTSLPGGPEDDSLGARGAVFKVNPSTGKATKIAGGFLGATDLALTPNGGIYVTELFGNALSKVVNGKAVKVADLASPGAVEYGNGALYVTTGVFGSGAVVKVTP